MTPIYLATIPLLLSIATGTPVTMDVDTSVTSSKTDSASTNPIAAQHKQQYYYSPIYQINDEQQQQQQQQRHGVTEKRAFAYRSEGKRLPVFSFGLGKRADEVDGLRDNWDIRADKYSFGLGKRMKPYSFGLGKRAKPYSFGLGKRSNYDEAKFQNLMSNIYAQKLLENYLESKRAAGSGFNFGLGKRDSELDNIMGDNEDVQERLPIKIPRDNRYGFGLGKRENSDNMNQVEYYDEDDISLNSAQIV